jgi:hypothetical protein
VLSRFCAIVSCLLALNPRTAGADPSPLPASSADLDANVGFSGGGHSGGPTFGVLARLRHTVLTGGVGLQLTLDRYNSIGTPSTLAGLSLPFGPVRFDALGEFGANAYFPAGTSGESDRATVVLPFLGGRVAILGRVVDSQRNSVWMGVSALYARDLYTTTTDITYHAYEADSPSDVPLFSYSSTVELGQSRLGMFAVAGLTLPL